MKRFYGSLFLCILILLPRLGFSAVNDKILNPEEVLWLKSRNNTIVVYPEKSFAPFSSQNSAGLPQGLSIDYIELIAKKLGVKINYLQPRPLSQILEDVKNGKGDIVTSLTSNQERNEFLYFTDSYISVPTVIVVRKDSEFIIRSLNDLVGRKVGIGDKYAVEDFIRSNNPKIVIEPMVDDETSLQQLVLGEVDASIIDVASLSYYLSKQVLNSVKIANNVGFEYELAFAVPKDKEILQSILDKGLQQITINERKTIQDKWIVIPNEQEVGYPLLKYLYNNISTVLLYILLIIIIVLLIKRNRKYLPVKIKSKMDKINELKEEIIDLEDTSNSLKSELDEIKGLEENIKNKIKKMEV